MNIRNACDLDIFSTARRFVDNLCGATEPERGFRSKARMNLLRKYGLKMLSELIDGLTHNGYSRPPESIKKAAAILRAIKWELCEALENRDISIQSFASVIKNALETESMINGVICPGRKTSYRRN